MFICRDYWEKQSCYSNQYIKQNCLHPLYVCKNEKGIPEFTFDQNASDCFMSSLTLNKQNGKIGWQHRHLCARTKVFRNKLFQEVLDHKLTEYIDTKMHRVQSIKEETLNTRNYTWFCLITLKAESENYLKHLKNNRQMHYLI